ncbi:ATP-binding protein [Paludisphaera mucosa]|uniref:histidine kinase n=1 Tax=Paludisphaera mucosa TaxID=3030827 RepID=A0ABT6FEL4_9BACT|nr:ATP-binding protein [Paludisphaera mucosa]MDG3005984.1 ATP-binding protein [Paludisphaera mucosa]
MTSTSIRVRLTAWYAGMLTIILVALGAAVYVLMARALVERVDAMLDFEFQEAAERLAEGRAAGELAREPEAFHESYFLRVLDSEARILAESRRLAGLAMPLPGEVGTSLPRRRFDVHLGGLGRCRVVVGGVAAGAGPRIVQIATSLDGVGAELAELRGVLLTILPIGFLAATLGGYWLAASALAPVERMAEAARRISAENLGERLVVKNPGDELGRLASTLNAMLDRIDRAFVATRRFTADAAHELKTPVASIRAEAEVALAARRSPEDYEETLRSVVEEAARLGRLADRMLELSREDSGAAPPRRTMRLDDAVREAVAAARGAATRAGLDLRLEDLPDADVDGDHEGLRQAFADLLDNAIKYTPAGGSITVRGGLADGRAAVEVSDTGVGIPGDALPRLYDRFYRADPSRSRRTGGVGLGLSIAKAVVERHGGTIDVESVPGSGSTFRVSLPVDPASSRRPR